VVGNLTATIASIVQTRSELTLSPLGSAICGPEHTEAGTQRLQRALPHQEDLLDQAARRWGRQVRHVFDRGYGHGPWLNCLSCRRLRLVVRWKKGNRLLDASGQERQAWEIARGKRPWGEARLLWDTHCRVYRSTRVLALPVSHPQYDGQFWLVVLRQGKGREAWYLLSLLDPSLLLARCQLFVGGCPRADWRLWAVKVPLYRLRWALSRLWQTHPPRFSGCHSSRPRSHITWPVCSLAWWTTLWHQCGFLF
jgi:hypothetical protein